MVIVGLLLLVLAGLEAWRALRVWVTAPLLDLGSDAREVASGELSHVIAPIGPPELQQLAADIEAMRQRIVGELEQIVAARADLDARNTDLARSNVELEQFAYVASHDLQERCARADQYIDFAVDGAKRMQVLINDLLTFSRVGRNTTDFVDVDLASCLQSALSNLSSAIAEEGATVNVAVLPVVRGDEALLISLWQNLFGNSLKFRGADQPVVAVEATRVETEWVCSVTDNGIGIEPRFAERIFVIFQRLHGRDTYEGTGIGLALCKKIVEFHGGRIWLDTDHEPGTRLYFSLPATEGLNT